MVMIVRGGSSSLAENSTVLLRFVVVDGFDVVVLVELMRHAVKDRVPHKCRCSHCHPSRQNVPQFHGLEQRFTIAHS